MLTIAEQRQAELGEWDNVGAEMAILERAVDRSANGLDDDDEDWEGDEEDIENDDDDDLDDEDLDNDDFDMEDGSNG